MWLYFRFTLSFWDVEELLAQREIEVSYETIRCWTIKFGPQVARNLKRKRPAPSPRWHLDELVCNVGRKRMHLWRAVDAEGKVPDMVMQRRRDTVAVLKLIKRLRCNQPFEPVSITTDGLGSYPAALSELGLIDLHRPSRLRERKMQGFKSQASARRFLITHAATYNTFYIQPHLIRRPTLAVSAREGHAAWAASAS